MHDSVMAWVGHVLTADDVAGSHVVEAGALDVNGSVRKLVEAFGPASYLATDMRAGPGVDLVCDAASLPVRSAGLVVSTEMLEHAQHWTDALTGMHNALAPGGLLVVTTRGPGFGKHDHPGDYWRFTPGIIAQALLLSLQMELHWLQPDPDYPGVFAAARRFTVPDLSPEWWPDAIPMT